MRYRKAGKTGEDVSILGFGCMRLPTLDKPHLIDEEQAQAMVDYAIANGVNYFDTAYVYHSEIPFRAGQSEAFLGRALKRHRRKVQVATKLPSWFVKSRSDMDRYLDQQLGTLQTGQIDFYLLHSLTAELWKNLRAFGVLEFLEAALADGRIKHAGFSFHDELPLFKEIVDAYDWSFCQIQYNFMDEQFQAGAEGLEYAAAKGLGVIIMEPLRGGSLTSRLPAQVQTLWDCAPVKRTPAEWALRFVWDRPEPCVVLSGMSNLEQVVENVRIANASLPRSITETERVLIQQVKAVYQARTKVTCTTCGYCLPCPSGVSIPANFLQLNNLSIYEDRPAAEFFYFHLLNEQQRASHCDECGQCEDLCPQDIPIREMLKEVVHAFEGAGV